MLKIQNLQEWGKKLRKRKIFVRHPVCIQLCLKDYVILIQMRADHCLAKGKCICIKQTSLSGSTLLGGGAAHKVSHFLGRWYKIKTSFQPHSIYNTSKNYKSSNVMPWPLVKKVDVAVILWQIFDLKQVILGLVLIVIIKDF